MMQVNLPQPRGREAWPEVLDAVLMSVLTHFCRSKGIYMFSLSLYQRRQRRWLNDLLEALFPDIRGQT